MPSEADVMTTHDVGRNTARAALGELEAQGLISTSRGGRIVRNTHRWTWPMTRWEKNHTGEADAWNNTIVDQGGTPASDVTVTVVQADPDVAAALDVEPGVSLYLRSRLRWVDGEPHQLVDSYFPPWLTEAAPVFSEPGDISAPGGLLAANGHPQRWYSDEVTARMPSPDEANALWMSTRGAPLLVHMRIGYGHDGRPLRYMITRSDATRVTIKYDVEA